MWSVTSNKPGNGVEYLRDNNVETYWQSDGTQPHLVNIQFQRKVRVLEVVLYVDYRNDESYTPQKVRSTESHTRLDEAPAFAEPCRVLLFSVCRLD